MTYSSKITLTSKLPEYSGVAFTLTKLTEGRRSKLNLSLAPHKAKLRELLADMEVLNPTVEEGTEAIKLEPHTLAKIQNLSDEITVLVNSEINAAWVLWGLLSISGLDEITTAAQLINDGPPELYSEVLAAIKKETELTPKKK